MRTTQSLIGVVAGSLAIFSLTGCKIFIPAQANSNHRVPDKLTITFLPMPNVSEPKPEDLEFITNYIAAFPGVIKVVQGLPPTEKTMEVKDIKSYLEYLENKKRQKFAFAAVAAPLVAAGVQAGMNFVAQSFTNEAALYQETFLGNTLEDRFLKRVLKQDSTNYVLNYYGFKITRDISLSKSVTTNAYALICGFGPTADGTLFRVKPLVFRTSYSGAKVVGDDFKSTWLNTTLTLGISWLYTHCFMTPNHAINSQVNVDFVAFAAGSNQTLQQTPMGAFSYKVSSYDIAHPKTLHAGAGTLPDMISTNAGGFLLNPPLSYKLESSKAEPVTTDYAGNVDTTASLLESDASNAKATLSKIGQLISQQTPKVTLLASNAVMEVH